MNEKPIIRFPIDESLGVNSDDRLGRTIFVQNVAKMLQFTKAPFIFGLMGGWGSGKSSLLNLIQRKLVDPFIDTNGTKYIAYPVLFEAWRYESEESLFVPMLHSLISAGDELKTAKSDIEHMRERFVRVAGATLLSIADWGLKTITSRASYGAAAISIKDIIENFDSIQNEWGIKAAKLIDQVEESRRLVGEYLNEFRRVCATYHGLSQEQVKVVYLIDDLDRCKPEKVVELIESLKHFCSTSEVVTLIAVNQEILERSITVKYPTLKIDGRRYLEKIINHTFRVPQPLPNELKEFCIWQLQERILNLDALSADFRKRIYDTGMEIGEATFKLGLFNPRKIWRVINRLALAIEIIINKGGKIGDAPWHAQPLFLLIVLAEDLPDLFRALGPEVSTKLENITRQLPESHSKIDDDYQMYKRNRYLAELGKTLEKYDQKATKALYEVALEVSDLDPLYA